ANPSSLLIQLFYGFPNLVDFLKCQFGLIEQKKMLIQVFFIKEDKTFSGYILASTCPTGFLHIVFQRIRNLKVNDHSYIVLVHSHSKCRGSHNNIHFTIDKGVLI